jgi:Cell wall binding domain 2 (CWB2)
VARNQPINAEVPAPKPLGERAEEPPSKPPAARRKRKPIPPALKLIAATVVVAVVFLIAAILGGRGGREGGTSSGPPAPIGNGAQKPETPAAQIANQLGYPSFATKNTTRVGGADPASNAAGVSLATFPSTTAAQRPAAVTLVGEDDWQGAIAASVLMAAPVDAPVLISTPDGLPESSAQAFSALDPQGSADTGRAQAFVIGDVAAPGGLEKVTQVKAAAAATTAAKIELLRDRLFGSAPAHVVVAPAEQPGFAMPAAAWAARSGDPVLFAGENQLPKPTAAALKRHRDVPVYVLGPPSAISAEVVKQIAKISRPVRRVSGEDPVSSAIALARYTDGSFGWNINDPGHGFVIARSDSPLDAAAAAPLSASGTWGPLLLTDSADTLPAALRGYLLDVKPGYTTDPTRAFYNHVWVIGDQEAIDVSQQSEIDNLAELTKIGGAP